MNVFYYIQSHCSKSSEIMANKTLSWEVEFCIAKAFIMGGFSKCTRARVSHCSFAVLLFCQYEVALILAMKCKFSLY